MQSGSAGSTVVDLDNAADVLRAELDENTCRKALTPYEGSRARERRANVLAPSAAERIKAGKKSEEPPCANLAQGRDARKTRNVAAIGTGYSGSTLDKVDRIRDAAERGVVRRGKTEVPVPQPVKWCSYGREEHLCLELLRTRRALDREVNGPWL